MKAGKPRSIRIEDNSNGREKDFRLYKVWSRKKESPEPFLITDSLEDLLEVYQLCCKDYGLKIDQKTHKSILKLVNKHTNKQKEFTHEKTNFLKSSFLG